MQKKLIKQSVGAGFSASLLTLSLAAVGQDTVLEEVVVTASKRALALEDLAGSANVLGTDKLGPGGIQEVRDMQVNVPNLSLGDQFGFARVFMRGVGMTSIDIGGEGAVAFLQDGAIVPRPAAQLMGMFDLAQVEVLRGPQGTLYGRGATAGAINMVTQKPSDEPGGYVNLTVGNYGLTQLKGAVDARLSDSVLVRLAGSMDRREGYGENLFNGQDINDRNAKALRATFAYDAGGKLTGVLSAQIYSEDDQNYAFNYLGPSEGTTLPVPRPFPYWVGKLLVWWVVVSKISTPTKKPLMIAMVQ